MSGGPLMSVRTGSWRVIAELIDVVKSGRIITRTAAAPYFGTSRSGIGFSSVICSAMSHPKAIMKFQSCIRTSSRILSLTSTHSQFSSRCKHSLSQALRSLHLSDFNMKLSSASRLVNFDKQSVRLFCSPNEARKSKSSDTELECNAVDEDQKRFKTSKDAIDGEGKSRSSGGLRYDKIIQPLRKSSNDSSRLNLDSEADKDGLSDSSLKSNSDRSSNVLQTQDMDKYLSIHRQARKENESNGSSIVDDIRLSDASTLGVGQTSASATKSHASSLNENSSNVLSSQERISDMNALSTTEAERSSSVDESLINSERVEETTSTEEPPERMGLFKRFHHTYKQYGKVVVVVHCATSTVWTGLFYYAAMSGVDVEPALRWLGAGDTIVSFYTMPGVGNAAVAYLFYKLATPVRYPVTIAGTHLAVKWLRKFGYMPPVAQENTLRSLMTESKSQMKSQMKTKYHRYHDQIGDIRTEYKERRKNIDDWKKTEK